MLYVWEKVDSQDLSIGLKINDLLHGILAGPRVPLRDTIKLINGNF
mgnify:CR=1 FL=1